jgi:hypothetical protein
MKKVLRLTESDLTKIVKRVINESVDYYDKIVNILEPPYFKNLITIGISEDQWDDVLSKVYGESVKHVDYDGTRFNLHNEMGYRIYGEVIGGRWVKYGYDINGNNTYYENSDGEWEKWEYDSDDNQLYFENSYGYWEKQEFNKYGNRVYFENSVEGVVIDKRNNNLNESTDYYE